MSGRCSGRRPAYTAGFTLIELLVVVAILSAASLLAFGVYADDRTQIRYDDTRTRLQWLRRAILGQTASTGAATASGFVADNGDLPGDIATLMQAGTLLAQSVQTPVFDPQPDIASCANNGSEFPHPFGVTPDVNAQLIKGHRGNYLGGMAYNGHFRDGWGNVSPDTGPDALNSGWHVSLNAAAGTLNLASLGLDNSSGGADFAADIDLPIASNDWRVPLQGGTISVTNMAGDLNSSKNFSVSLLVFHNTPTGGEWRRYSTPIVSTACLDGDGNGTVDHDNNTATPEVSCPSRLTFSFSDNCKAGDPASGASLVPQGRHLLLLTAHAGTTLWDGSDTVFWTSGKRAMARVDAVAGIPLPPIELVLR